MSRPVLADVDDRKLAAARGTVLFDEDDASMVAYDGLQASWGRLALRGQQQQQWQQQEQQLQQEQQDHAGANAVEPLEQPAAPSWLADAAAAAGAADAATIRAAPAVGVAAPPVLLTSFSDLQGPPKLLKNMVKARLHRPTPVQR